MSNFYKSMVEENAELKRKVERLDHIRLLYLVELQKANKGIARLKRKLHGQEKA